MHLKENCISSKLIYDGRIVKLFEDEIELPNGAPAKREYIKHVGAVCGIAQRLGILAIGSGYGEDVVATAILRLATRKFEATTVEQRIDKLGTQSCAFYNLATRGSK